MISFTLTKKHLTIIISLIAVGIASFFFVYASEPGTTSDPIVSKSYVDSMYSWQVTSLTEGQTLSLDLGTEIIVRSGKVTVVGVTNGGLVDLTTGKELKDGEMIPLNHHIISPASDGRGIRTLSTIMIITKGLTK